MADAAGVEIMETPVDPCGGGQHTLVALDKALPATRLLEKRRLMFQVQEALEHQKIEAARKEEELTKREEELRQRDRDLQDSLIRFSKFLQENNIKRIRAEKRAANEMKVRQEKEAEISEIETTIGQLQHEKTTSKRALHRMMSYQKYLETVTEASSEFQEINDLLLRHGTLSSTNEELRKEVEECAVTTDALRADMQSYCKSSVTEILNLENYLAFLKQECDRKKQETGEMQKKVEAILEVASHRTLVRGQTSMAIENLFNRMHKKSRVYRPQYTNTLHQITALGDYLSDTNQIIKAFRSGKPFLNTN